MELVLLSAEFYEKYQGCDEILQKPNRPYLCVTIEVDGVKYAIPLRHHIKHRYAFYVDASSGLDYSKAIIVEDERYIGEAAFVDSETWKSIRENDYDIRKGFVRYLSTYRKALKHPDQQQNKMILQCSALQYFIK